MKKFGSVSWVLILCLSYGKYFASILLIYKGPTLHWWQIKWKRKFWYISIEEDKKSCTDESTCLEDKEGENEKKILEITQENKEEKWDNKSDKLEQTIIEQVTGEKKGGKDKWRSKRNCKSSWWIFE